MNIFFFQLLDACVQNCGENFLLEVASRSFETELYRLMKSSKCHVKVNDKLKECLKKWAETDFKGNPQLSTIPALYKKLKEEGVDLTTSSDGKKTKKIEYSNDPNVVNNKQEEDDIAKAIQLSLQSSTNKQSTYDNKTLYPLDLSSNLENLKLTDPVSSAPVKKARALYDFEAAEDNELTFNADELIVILDSSDQNWWKGSNHRGEGLFPANFVTLDLDGGADNQDNGRNGKRVSFNECIEVSEVDEHAAAIQAEEITGEINEEQIDTLLHYLHEADPTGERPDDAGLPLIEQKVTAMTSTIDSQLEQVDRTHNELAKLNTEMMSALNLYHQVCICSWPDFSSWDTSPAKKNVRFGQIRLGFFFYGGLSHGKKSLGEKF